MNIIRFLSRFTLICNICFLLFVLFSYLEVNAPKGAVADMAARIPFFKELIIVLGFSAIVINSIMCITYLILILLKKKTMIPKWTGIFNVFLLIAEVYYFIF